MTQLMVRDSATMIANPEFMNSLHMFAQTMAQATVTVPKHLAGNTGDCMAICMQAAQWGMNPFAVAQKTHVVQGNLGYEGQLINAVVSSSNAIQGRFKYEYGNDWENGKHGHIRCGAILKDESEITWGEWLNCSEVKTKNSPVWKSAPKQQAAYLVVKMWARLYTPDVIMGVYTPDELQEIEPVRKIDSASAKPSFASRLQDTPEQAPDIDAPAIEDRSQVDYESLTVSLIESAKHCTNAEEVKEVVELVQNHNLPEEYSKRVGEVLREAKNQPE